MMQKTPLFVLAFSMTLWTTAGCSAPERERATGSPGTLSPCPNTPNCVSTQAADARHTLPPLPYAGTRQESFDHLVRILRGMKRCSIVSSTGLYIHAECRSAVFGFVDDVEFLFDDDERQIHFRSAARSGYYDFGVNRRRMKDISEGYLASIESSSPEK